ncbi:MAG TPA: hypothetical protein PL187_06725, partial [Caldilinea sp.]|nr:hypothetical protein [Caldilinea sp.]
KHFFDCWNLLLSVAALINKNGKGTAAMYAGKACNQLTFDVARRAIQYSTPADEQIPVVG